ncbi:S. pombe specific GPI anchored protein family 1 [Schizosaccharomyces pombe]|uniref:Uncharacterized GPI-anchored protein SPAC750.07c n=2 Tax=Schizosaccharomyces pombe (strain 972 / ATCC 24843) TaxID=284812 RepID=YLZ7_SCHPO|nr:GPI-anchored protein [Schizosaccharomyces pombe]NP_595033.1 GPI-anchored protein [Schizosaccharomyces pombe]C6Y4B5.1 RecName: Full=Uncharacterized GPI-anchored protein SPAC212.12; Flags: Precursor [Schizosaccharomyces pombe 972h-]Q9P3E4.1 RecName: Full=Uncharacterized GPI-anchored protein SPAC750.07c; Flags: Precursor [Schizosaccharomyces pombe 972h-]CAB98258.1 S. pombe specific GPI anchored protein family 1 [Schizosaccharomyces pombe]CBA11488.2 S. pombe specific GPI anchored protein family|eukprot:NP_001343063.1 GPI-anchored protein [Schizosaccharomyces pombe]
MSPLIVGTLIIILLSGLATAFYVTWQGRLICAGVGLILEQAYEGGQMFNTLMAHCFETYNGVEKSGTQCVADWLKVGLLAVTFGAGGPRLVNTLGGSSPTTKRVIYIVMILLVLITLAVNLKH